MTDILTGLLPTLALAGLIAYYFLILKPKQDEKNKKRQAPGAKNTAPVEPDTYAEIINDYPQWPSEGV